jgi:hypothetical protein
MSVSTARWMKDGEQVHIETILRLFGDSLDHTVTEICQQSYMLGFHKRMRYDAFVPHFRDVLFRRLVLSGQVKMTEDLYGSFFERKYRIAVKGDQHMREMNIRRGGDESYYRYHTRLQNDQPIA